MFREKALDPSVQSTYRHAIHLMKTETFIFARRISFRKCNWWRWWCVQNVRVWLRLCVCACVCKQSNAQQCHTAIVWELYCIIRHWNQCILLDVIEMPLDIPLKRKRKSAPCVRVCILCVFYIRALRPVLFLIILTSFFLSLLAVVIVHFLCAYRMFCTKSNKPIMTMATAMINNNASCLAVG